MKPLRIYIAGPMTFYPYFNFPAFDAKRDELKALGHFPVSPADLDRAMGFDPSNLASVAAIPIDEKFMDNAIVRDVLCIIACDAIVMLEGWEKSRGASGELGVAKWKGLSVYFPGDEVPAALTPAA
ncbi:MAG: DUF4406 domain-containing protein [Vulcanimicrobiaceae bacterium]